MIHPTLKREGRSDKRRNPTPTTGDIPSGMDPYRQPANPQQSPDRHKARWGKKRIKSREKKSKRRNLPMFFSWSLCRDTCGNLVSVCNAKEVDNGQW